MLLLASFCGREKNREGIAGGAVLVELAGPHEGDRERYAGGAVVWSWLLDVVRWRGQEAGAAQLLVR